MMKKILSFLLLTIAVLASCKKEDTPPAPKPDVVGAVSLNKTTATIVVGAKETLIATVTPEGVTDKSVTWASSDPAVATVSQTGEVSAIKEGSTNITATSVADKTKSATCAVTVKPVALPVAVGDFYYADNTYSTTYDATKTLIGIVFDVNPNGVGGKIVSLDEAVDIIWSNVAFVTGAEHAGDGAVNMATIKALADWEDNYPVFVWCNDHTEGGKTWYLPAFLEIMKIYNNYDKLNVALNAAGKTPLSEEADGAALFYWTSTDPSNPNVAPGSEATSTNFSTGLTSSTKKTHNDNTRARAVATF